jgi:pheromone shutdown-related protein TraB
MEYKNITFIGTSHIARQSLKEVRNAIIYGKPQVIAIELDPKRLNALMQKGPRKISLRAIARVGLKGFIFSLIGAWAEEKLGSISGVAPGSEMKQAIILARKNGINLALIDQDIEITLSRLSKSITWKEKLNFIKDIAKAPFTKNPEVSFDLRTVPDEKVIKTMMEKLKIRYPNVYRTLVEERNAVIAQNLHRLMQDSSKKILAVLGAGHVQDVIEIIRMLEEPKLTYRFSIGK